MVALENQEESVVGNLPQKEVDRRKHLAQRKAKQGRGKSTFDYGGKMFTAEAWL
jgi:hypothetical protein